MELVSKGGASVFTFCILKGFQTEHLWHMDYFELKSVKVHKTQEELLCPPLNFLEECRQRARSRKTTITKVVIKSIAMVGYSIPHGGVGGWREAQLSRAWR